MSFGVSTGGNSCSDFEKILHAELCEIAKAGSGSAVSDALRSNGEGGASDADSSRAASLNPENLSGLAFSGGGIRSAAFNLGIVQVLNEQRLIEKFHYLSTVSGGGYLGACISCILAQDASWRAHLPGLDGRLLPFFHETGKVENAVFRHLRNAADYLRPPGSHFAAIPALMLQGLIRNLLAVLPVILALVILVFALYLRDAPETPSQTPMATVTQPVAVNAGAGERLMQAGEQLVLAGRELRGERAPLKVESDPGTKFYLHSDFRASMITGGLALAWIALLAPILRTRAYTADRRERLNRLSGWLVTLSALAVFVDLQPMAVHAMMGGSGEVAAGAAVSAGGILAVGWGWLQKLAGAGTSPMMERVKTILLPVVLTLLAPLLLWLLFILLAGWALDPPTKIGSFSWEELARSWTPTTILAVYAVLAVLLILLFWFLYDVNATSLHTFYRDRLSRTFLFKCRCLAESDKPFLDPYEGPLLSELSSRPYHLINATLNVQRTKTNLRGRDADTFLFSKLYIGSALTGWCDTKRMEEIAPDLELRSAMAISGAAFDANLGRQPQWRPIRLLLALVNVRLGYWLPNPRRINGSGWRLLGRPSPYNFLAEALGLLSDESKQVYLTDGGHIENLGAFELLRRRCRFIVIGDAEADTEHSFEGLAHLMRMARIDLGVKIDIDLTNLRLTPPGMVRAHCAMGRIDYGGGVTGRLLYIKASAMGDETEYVTEYRARHPDFPHETTLDQFFDEAQFEAYRALGYHIACKLFDGRASLQQLETLQPKQPPSPPGGGAAGGPTGNSPPGNMPSGGGPTGGSSGSPPGIVEMEPTRARLSYDSIEAWFDALAGWLQPQPADTETYLALREAIGEITDRLGDPAAAAYLREIYPEMAPGASGAPHSPATLDEAGLALVAEQLRVIERAILEMNLDEPRNRLRESNRGLMNLFRRWSQAPLFRQGWAILGGTFSPDLERFCREALELTHDLNWSDATETLHGVNDFERSYLEYYRKKQKHDSGCPLRLLAATAAVAGQVGVPTGQGIDPFVVAIAVVGERDDRSLLYCLRVRDTYRRQGLAARLAPLLARTIAGAHEGRVPLYTLEDVDRQIARPMRRLLDAAGFKEVRPPE